MVRYPRVWDTHPFLSFGLPFLSMVVGGTHLLAYFLEASYEEKARRQEGFGKLAEKRKSIPLSESLEVSLLV